ncbi:hypothetical protein [Alkalicoccus urumqiensis]|uniref:Uncharacterized protein n=1 Tax=Alkalicoccus urumqiensis TaxID=1548213 RepID=A0A2P6MK87_ALKUR|nr:hypothetical protein [Alkalicoccus urumqiensis]PRO66681.1 hypothetical protein C6I21_01775 [Alkalicoccus urumqiensis]
MRGNWLVVLLPLAVMAGLFAAGYFTLGGGDGMTNAQLQDNMQIDVADSSVSWQWGAFPEDGVAGPDIVEFVTSDEVDVSAELTQAGEVIASEDGVVETEDGTAVWFQTFEEEGRTTGASGTAFFEGSGVESVRYYHTWANIDMELMESSSVEQVLSDRLPGQYWMVEMPLGEQ